MMGIVPVRDSVVRGYTFLFARFFTVLGLGWLPAAFYGIACSWLLRAVSTGALGAPPSSGAFNQYSLGYLAAMLLVTAFFSAPMLIPFTREALGMHEEAVAAHFSYGPREWRLFVALLRFFGIVGGALFVLVVGSGIAISQFAPGGAWLGVPGASWLNFLALTIVLSTGAFLSVRLGFFLAPIAAVEGHANLARAWVLSRQNFWRLAAIFLAVAIPMLFVVLIWEYALWGSDLGAATRVSGSGALAIFKLQYDHSISIAAMLAAALMAVNALFAPAAAEAYQALDAEAGETAVSAPESDWGIHRAPAFADAGPPSEQQAHERIEPQEAVLHPQLQMEVAKALSGEASAPESIVENVNHAPANVEEPAALEVPAELPADEGNAAHAESEIERQIIESKAPGEMPPLDPAGLAQAAKERETA
jgi:hypothetical protein